MPSIMDKTGSPGESKTDWERVKREYESGAPIPYDDDDRAEGLYDPNDDAAVEAFLKEATVKLGVRGKQKKPTKQLVAIRLSPNVVEHFKSKGKGWQTQIDQALLAIVQQAVQESEKKSLR